MIRLTPAFAQRVFDMNSYTFTKDFLDKYPDLRGAAPQHEASLTTRRLVAAAVVVAEEEADVSRRGRCRRVTGHSRVRAVMRPLRPRR